MAVYRWIPRDGDHICSLMKDRVIGSGSRHGSLCKDEGDGVVRDRDTIKGTINL